MTKHSIAVRQKQEKTEYLLKAAGFCLPASAVITACCICFFSKMPIPVENPAILTLASFFVLVPFKSKPLNTLQKIMVFYLVSVLVNELSSQYFRISFLLVDVSISYSAVILVLCVTGYLVERVNPTSTRGDVERANILYGWALALVIIIVHMVSLALMLNKFYGYGYEQNLSVMGNLCLYLLLFIFLWDKLDKLRFRQGIGLIVTVFFLAVTIAKK